MSRQPSPIVSWPCPSRVRIIGRRDWPERRRPLKGATGTLERPAEVQGEQLPGFYFMRLDQPAEDGLARVCIRGDEVVSDEPIAIARAVEGLIMPVASAPERVTIEAVVGMVGLPRRTVQEMAQRGDIPGALKIGRRWTFDRARVRRWLQDLEGEACRKRALTNRGTSIGADASGGSDSRLPAMNGAQAYEQTMSRLLSGARGRSGTGK